MFECVELILARPLNAVANPPAILAEVFPGDIRGGQVIGVRAEAAVLLLYFMLLIVIIIGIIIEPVHIEDDDD